MSRRVRTTLVCGLACTLAACTAPEPAEPGPTASTGRTSAGSAPEHPAHGAAGIGDRYYPRDGNGGYDAKAYDVSIGYQPGNGRLSGDTVVTATATQDLDRFNLDLRGLDVESVEVNGERAEYRRDGAELVVSPANPLGESAEFRTRVRYEGVPQDADAAQLGGNGWHRAASGGAYAIGEPRSASYWYPVNEHPRDKARFSLTARVPEGWSAVSIGRQRSTSSDDGWTTTTWAERNPIPSYLTTVAIDRFTIERSRLADGTPVVNAFAPGAEQLRGDADRVGEVVRFLSGRFGPYPADTAGGIYLADDVGYSLETQGRPTYTRGVDVETIVHELAHQWYGNSVSVRSWADICLNECLASYAQWLWAEGKRGEDLDARYHRAIENYGADESFWSAKLYDMGAGDEFNGVYDKGILAVHALRRKLGEQAFDQVLKRWPARHRDGTASWPEFERFVGGIAGQDLRGFFDAWFHGDTLPRDEFRYPGTLAR